MIFQHPEVQQIYERVLNIQVSGLPEQERPIFALMDAYGWFRLIESEASPKVHEIIAHLLSPELRPALRSWYQRHSGRETNSIFTEFRDRLSHLANERFE